MHFESNARTVLSAVYTSLLARHNLPNMSADELLCEIDAVREGEKSAYLVGPVSDEARAEVARFYHAWDAMEDAEERVKEALRAEARSAPDRRGLVPERFAMSGDFMPVWGVHDPEDRWNGFAKPLVTPEAALEWVRRFRAFHAEEIEAMEGMAEELDLCEGRAENAEAGVYADLLPAGLAWEEGRGAMIHALQSQRLNLAPITVASAIRKGVPDHDLDCPGLVAVWWWFEDGGYIEETSDGLFHVTVENISESFDSIYSAAVFLKGLDE